MTEFENVLMKRDGMDKQEARRCRAEASELIEQMLDEGGGYDDIEDLLLNDYGLEMDYIFDLI